MSKSFLLTYEKENQHEYGWFNTEDELKDFVSEIGVTVHDALEVNGYHETSID